MSWGCLWRSLSCAGHSARALAGSKGTNTTTLEMPMDLSVSENRTRAGPPKSGFRGFEELSAVRSRRGFGWCTRWIDGDLYHGGGTAGSFECVGMPQAQQVGQVLRVTRKYLFTGSLFISSSNAHVAMPILARRWHAGGYVHAGCRYIIQCHRVMWKLLM